MSDQKCPKCGTMLTAPGFERVGTDWLAHDLPRCRDILHAQLTSERAKVEEAMRVLDRFAAWDEGATVDGTFDAPEVALAARVALEKLRGQ